MRVGGVRNKAWRPPMQYPTVQVTSDGPRFTQPHLSTLSTSIFRHVFPAAFHFIFPPWQHPPFCQLLVAVVISIPILSPFPLSYPSFFDASTTTITRLRGVAKNVPIYLSICAVYTLKTVGNMQRLDPSMDPSMVSTLSNWENFKFLKCCPNLQAPNLPSLYHVLFVQRFPPT